MQTFDSKKYIFSFLITAVIFFTAVLASNYFSQKKLQEVRTIQDQIAINILSSEVQTSLLEEFSCKNVADNALSQELGSLGEKLSYTEEARGSDAQEVIDLKRYYSLLQIKDYILMNRIREKCGTKNEFIIYFYTKDCEECQRQGYVLTKLREDYPELRVYSFDYNLDVSAIKTLISVTKSEENMPALYIKDEMYYGYKSVEDIEKIVPQLRTWKLENETMKNATSTKATTTNRR